MMGSERPGRRCLRHGLAAGQDGLCALCHRESRPPPPRWPGRLLAGLLGAILLACVALIAHRALSRIGTVVQPELVGSASTSPAAPAQVQTQQPLASSDAPAPRETAPPREPEPLPPPNASGESIALPDPVPPPAKPIAEAAPAAPSGAASGSPSEPGNPSQADLQAAVRATPIVMYATTWCG